MQKYTNQKKLNWRIGCFGNEIMDHWRHWLAESLGKDKGIEEQLVEEESNRYLLWSCGQLQERDL
jgi:hypothetical protein